MIACSAEVSFTTCPTNVPRSASFSFPTTASLYITYDNVKSGNRILHLFNHPFQHFVFTVVYLGAAFELAVGLSTRHLCSKPIKLCMPLNGPRP